MTSPTAAELTDLLARALPDLTLTHRQAEQFLQYEALLLEWNSRFNLTAIRDVAGIRLKHFADSLMILRALPEPAGPLIDIGSGAGFPGLALKIALPELPVTLVEATGKKCRFLEAVVDSLALKGVSILNARAEELAHDPLLRQQFQTVTARAVAALPTLSEYMLPLAAPGGVCVAQKGTSAPDELEQSRNAIRILGGKPQPLVAYSLPSMEDTRYLVLIDKVKPTPPQYPRPAGAPVKRPL